MSVRTWKEEFFSGIQQASKHPVRAAEHSLRKWKGLTEANLAKHNLRKIDGEHYIYSTKTSNYFEVGGNECALCRYSKHVVGYNTCDACPLADAMGGVTCVDRDSPYTIWLDTGNAAPMIKALKKAAAI